jgi:hypothetical protein
VEVVTGISSDWSGGTRTLPDTISLWSITDLSSLLGDRIGVARLCPFTWRFKTSPREKLRSQIPHLKGFEPVSASESNQHGVDAKVCILPCTYGLFRVAMKFFSGHLALAVRPQSYLEMFFLGEHSLAKRALEVWTCRCIICHRVLYMVSCNLTRGVEPNVGIVGCTAQDPLA